MGEGKDTPQTSPVSTYVPDRIIDVILIYPLTWHMPSLQATARTRWDRWSWRRLVGSGSLEDGHQLLLLSIGQTARTETETCRCNRL